MASKIPFDQDPAEGSPEVIERELKRQDERRKRGATQSHATQSHVGGPASQVSGSAARTTKPPGKAGSGKKPR